ncbi:ricin-type beta-trefoil lectin domain protein [Streptomyces sp. DG2A-72]|uniref:ricin-type beta-trefoil lectin domain protein n=1 Tax=Streptomyces sp. DG2A-72 TaxID=3051386 RepID=UPI00265B9DA3|nr:ricin-type beta-trefoil lectin domain protein [Streptomyces sp. DG2A-72]MDO0938704.1 ricin-type beta-trefoil lectin domain protein [Streptomyces sp. DG2A-72]
MKDAGLPNSPTPAPLSEVTDEQLSTELRKWTGTAPALHPVGELLDRHWEAAFAYARLCADGPRAAGMLTTAAFTRLFGESLRQTGPTAAWRPQLLVTVRRIAAEWDGDHRRELLHPELRSEAWAGDRIAARLLPTADRRLLSGAFQRLPQSARCLLWHTEVEGEPLRTPAALLGLDEQDAIVELQRARERLREECLQVHRELAPEQECGRFQRMLDVTYRRGGVDVDPDLRTHLDGCQHCRYTAGQLDHFNDGLGTALAEAVLGWGARAYRESRAEEPEAVEAVTLGEEPQAQPPFAGEEFASAVPSPRALSPRSAHKAARRAARRRNVTMAVAIVSGLVVLPLVLWSAFGSGDDTTPSDGDHSSDEPVTGTSPGNPSWAGSGEETDGTLSGRLHNVDSGLCIGIEGKKAVDGAEAEVTKCSAAAGQQWSYETDGLLRNVADPDFCLDSHLGYSIRLAPCTGTSQPDTKNVRYDFTLQGSLVPRWNQDLALTSAEDGAGVLVLKNRDDSAGQRWVIDTAKTDLQMEVVKWDTAADTSKPPVPPTPSKTPTPTPTASPEPTPTTTPSTAQPTPTPTSYPSCYAYYCSWNNQYGWYGHGYGGHGYDGWRR